MTSEQTRSRPIEADWIRVTHGTVAKTLLLSVLVSLVTAPVFLLLGNPVGQAAGLDGSLLSWVWSLLGSAAIVLVVVGPWLLLRAAPGVLAHESGERVRVGWFTVPAARIRRARLVPDAFLHGRLVVQLVIAWVPDVRIGFANQQGLELDRRGLDALIRVVQRSSIAPEPGLRPRLLLEPGESEIDPRLRLERDMAQVEPTSYSREVLLRELSRLRDAAAHEQPDPATSFARVTGWWQPEDFYREVPGRIRRFLRIDAPAAGGAVPQLSKEEKQRMRARRAVRGRARDR